VTEVAVIPEGCSSLTWKRHVDPTTRREHSRAALRYETNPTDAEWVIMEPLRPDAASCGRPSACLPDRQPDTPGQRFVVDTSRRAWPACRRWEREYTGPMAVSLPDLKAFLLTTPFFGGLADASLDLLVSMLVERRFDAGATVVAEGEQGRSMFIVHSGELVVSKRGDSGREIRIAGFEPGDFFGEMTLIEMQNRSATVLTESPTVLYELTARNLYTYYKADIHGYVMVIQNINRELCRRLRRADNRMAELQDASRGSITQMGVRHAG
jgi:CRP/FNR family cyclic AMP-dependent transcriptional regulator